MWEGRELEKERGNKFRFRRRKKNGPFSSEQRNSWGGKGFSSEKRREDPFPFKGKGIFFRGKRGNNSNEDRRLFGTYKEEHLVGGFSSLGCFLPPGGVGEGGEAFPSGSSPLQKGGKESLFFPRAAFGGARNLSRQGAGSLRGVEGRRGSGRQKKGDHSGCRNRRREGRRISRRETMKGEEVGGREASTSYFGEGEDSKPFPQLRGGGGARQNWSITWGGGLFFQAK